MDILAAEHELEVMLMQSTCASNILVHEDERQPLLTIEIPHAEGGFTVRVQVHSQAKRLRV